ncbi:MAG: Crp/Fnr family transcriptional regulator [Armatimonadota bacterium]|jgi:CRP-like cAMP-binding protein
MTEENFLEQVAFLADLAAEDKEALVEGLEERFFHGGDVILHARDTSAHFFLIKSGKVKISLRSDESEREVTLTYLKPADFFGEMAIIDGEPRSATATAAADTTALVGSRDHFLGKLREHPQIALNLLAVMSARLRRADQQIEDLAFLDVQGRVARMLLDMAEREGQETEVGVMLRLQHTRQELANMVSTSRETLTRVLKLFERLGFIKLGRKKVMLTNVSRLQKKTL